ncbi:MAG: hypothetical protein LBM98_02905 [Oscillospiraceae bacterium]|nr:hypothetical protein [Oscillospiraceae bacterium]
MTVRRGGGRSCVRAAGNHPAAAAAPLHRGDGVWTWVTGLGKLGAARNDGAPGRKTWDVGHLVGIRVPATNVQTLVLIPSVEGCRPQAAGWFPAQGATPVQTLVSDI